MKTPITCLLVLMFAAAFALADKKDEVRFAPGPITSYPARQTDQNITIAAKAYDSEELAHSAFGKLDPYDFGILPILIIIQNDTPQAINAEHVSFEYLNVDHEHIEATPAAEVHYTNEGPQRPAPSTGSPIPKLMKHKNPLAAWEIEGRAFAVKMIPPHEQAYGFVYFQTRHMPGSKVFVNGLREAATGKELFYFEIPLEVNR